MECPICGATKNGSEFEVSYGPPLSPEKCYARICTYLKDPEKKKQCLNQDTEITPEQQEALGYRPL